MQLCFLFLAFSILAAAQTPSRVEGLAVDVQNHGVPAVRVILTSARTGSARESLTDEDGRFTFPNLAPGNYQARFEKAGFAATVAGDISAQVGVPVTLRVVLQPAAVSESVTVTAQTSTLNTADATIGNVITGQQITQLPLEGRNVVALLNLQPGVVSIGDNNVIRRTNFGEADADQRNGAVSGARSDQTNVTLDGVDVNDQQSGFAFNSVLRVGVETVQEFRVVTAIPGADLGRSAGAQVSLVTRSGGNEFHGSAFHSHRNTVTSANDFFNNRAGVQRPKLIRNVFGGSFGGPIRRNKLFFFGGYEGRRDASETSVIRNVPLDSLRGGSVLYRDTARQVRTLTPAQLRALDPAGIGASRESLEFLALYPKANDSPLVDPLNFGGFRFNSPTPLSLNNGTARLDYVLSPGHQIFARGNVQTDDQEDVRRFPATAPNFRFRNTSRGAAVGDNLVIRPNLLNSFRYGYTRAVIEDTGTTSGAQFSYGGDLGSPIPFTYSRGRRNPLHQIADDLTWTKGSHVLQFGTNIRWISNDRYNYEVNRPLFVTQVSRLAGRGAEIWPADLEVAYQNDYTRAAIIAMGVVSQANSAVNYDRNGRRIPLGEPVRRRFQTNEFEWYLQDSWRIRPNFTLNYGLRYSLYSPLRESTGLQVTPTFPLTDWFEMRRDNAARGVPSSATPPIQYAFVGSGSGAARLYDWDRDNFAPRVSAAWSLGKTAVRGGYSLLYDRVGSASAILYDSIGSFGLTSSLVNAAGSVTVKDSPRFRGPNGVYPEITPPAAPFQIPVTYPRGNEPGAFAIVPAADTRLRTPYTHALSFSIQREIAKDFVLDVAYVGRFGRNLLSLFDSAAPVNLRDPASGATYYDSVNQLAALGVNQPITGVARSTFWENLYPGLASTAGQMTQLYGATFTRFNPGLAASTPLTPTQTAYFLFAQAFRNNAAEGVVNIDRTCRPACGRLGPYAIYSDQFASLFSWRSISPSDYHSLQVIANKRFSSGFLMQFNYTLSKSLDWTSAAERGDAFSGAYIVNSFEPEQMRGPSDFDLRHQANANWVWQVPRTRRASIVTGGWQFAGIFRATSGFAASISNNTGKPTNFYFGGFATTRDGKLPEMSTNKKGPLGPSLFADPVNAQAAFTAPLTGQTGMRNAVRGDGLFSLDLGLSKSFAMPWSDRHRIAFRWEVFNVTNTVSFNVRSANLNLLGTGLGTYSNSLTSPRVMQFLARYEF